MTTRCPMKLSMLLAIPTHWSFFLEFDFCCTSSIFPRFLFLMGHSANPDTLLNSPVKHLMHATPQTSVITGTLLWNNSSRCTFYAILCLHHISVHDCWVSSHGLPHTALEFFLGAAWTLVFLSSAPSQPPGTPVLFSCVCWNGHLPFVPCLLSTLMFKSSPVFKSQKMDIPFII